VNLVSESIQTDKIVTLIEPTLTSLGFEVVRVVFVGEHTLQVMVDRANGGEVLVDHCAAVSRAVSAVLDVEDPIPGHYSLEVSSPGIDRPLTRAGDFDRFAGHQVKVELKDGTEGRKRFRGRLLGLAGEDIRLACDDAEVELPLAKVRRAKIVVTDELMAARQASADPTKRL
jgi:ribosome maturation factor RimP